MRTVRDDTGKRYLLVKQSSDSSRVRDPDTGEERYLDNAELAVVDGESPLETVAGGIPASVRRVMTAVPNDRALGLLIDLVDRGPVPVVDLLGSYDLCESDLHGLLTEFRAAGLVEEVRVYGERGYGATDLAKEGVGELRD
ncbi:hypothetical protein SAMN04487949_1005 [Halogranum gelatinilyticum]|uniref:Uncharacterized protein n=1 Tax=Halogranum gelatinilyticum TaxID=660521 RepID=A0A1G9QSH0_9EURY|nr:hypothetical protein [Halogranum gelatinilyticum]SDM13989.1 hypothetical protein SAMN04487949_1005 [Halogranum gelatinilyticum]